MTKIPDWLVAPTQNTPQQRRRGLLAVVVIAVVTVVMYLAIVYMGRRGSGSQSQEFFLRAQFGKWLGSEARSLWPTGLDFNQDGRLEFFLAQQPEALSDPHVLVSGDTLWAIRQGVMANIRKQGPLIWCTLDSLALTNRIGDTLLARADLGVDFLWLQTSAVAPSLEPQKPLPLLAFYLPGDNGLPASDPLWLCLDPQTKLVTLCP